MPAKKIKNKKIIPKRLTEKPLTISSLTQYNNKVFLPALELRFVTKKDFGEFKSEMYDFKSEMYEFKSEMYDFKSEMYEFKRETTTNFNDIKTRLDDIADTLDFIIKSNRDLDQEHTMQISTNQRVDKKLESHEKRIKKLEVTVK